MAAIEMLLYSSDILKPWPRASPVSTSVDCIQPIFTWVIFKIWTTEALSCHGVHLSEVFTPEKTVTEVEVSSRLRLNIK
jgi:hypothetical protein